MTRPSNPILASVHDWANDRYDAWLTLTMDPSQRLHALRCLLLGHQKVIEIPHDEICETYWDKAHLASLEGLVERVCRYCDSGYLSTRRRV